MMTNLLRSAFAANKLFSTIARLRLLLIMFLTLTVSANLWGQTKTDIMFAKGFGSYTTNSFSAAGTDRTAVANSTNATSVKYAMQVFNGSTGAVRGNQSSAASNFSCRNTTTYDGYYISQVSLTVSGGTIDGSTNGRSVVYFGTTAYGNPNTTTPSGTATKASPASSGQATLTWTNTNEDVSYFILYNLKTSGTALSANATNSLKVVWTKKTASAPSYTVTATSNNQSYGTVSVSGTTITADPNDGYRVKTGTSGYTVTSGNATVTNNGDNTFTVVPTTNCAITINFEAIPKYTVTWNVNGEVYETTQVTEGGKPTFPATPSSCDATSTTFYGWATATWDGKINDVSAKTIYTSANDMPAEAATYHAVFCEGGAGSVLINETFDDNSNTDSNTEINNTTFLNFNGASSKAFKSQYGGIKFGNSSSAGYITSKSLDLSTAFTVTLDACKFSSDAGNIVVTVGSQTQTIYNNSLGAAGKFNTYTLEFDAATSSSTVKIATSQKRAYIDNVIIATGGSASNFITTCTTQTTVTLNPNGGTFTSTLEGWAQDGNNYKQEDVTGSIDLPTPTKTGYNFDGWYDGTNEVESPYSPSETVTLVAKWTPIKYTIIFDKNNASATGTMSNQIFDYGTAQTLTQNTFTLIGYTFNGWNTKEDGSGTSYSDKQSVNNLTTTNNATITLYAQWKINTYKVTFNANGGTGSMSTQTFTHGQEQALNANSFTRDHYTFNGWKDGNDNTYTDKQSITLTADLTLYAQWTAKTYTITFNAGTGECGTGSATTTNAGGVTLPTVTHTCTDWTFVGWAEESVEETTIAPKFLEAGVTYKPTNDIILYAVYSKNEGGGGTTATSIMTYQDGTYYLIDSFTDANSNTTYHSPTGTKAGKLPSVDLTSAVVVNNGILTLDLTKASLNDNMKYTISKENDTYKIYNAETEAYVEPASGTDFKNTGASGWSIDDKNNRFMFNSGTRAFLYQDSYNSSGTKTYGRQFGNYAQSVAGTITNQNGKECYGSGYFFLVPAINSTTTYNSNPSCKYTVTWKLNDGQWQGGGTDDRVNNHNYGAEVTKPVNPSRTGYTFTGWSPAEIPATMPAENLEFTAQWTPTPYAVTWKLGEAEYATSTVNIENPLSTAPENPNDGDLGCCADKFMGWSSQQSPSAGDIFTKDNIPSNVTTAKTYYAVFATTAQGVGTSVADFSQMGYDNGTPVTDQIILGDGEGHGDATITLAKAQSSSNEPTYYTDGKAVRIYAGGTITITSTYNNATIKNIVFTFAGNDVVGENTITASSGTYDNGTWTGDASTVTFTISGSTGHRRIASITVTTGVTGSQYTNYVTQCTALPNPALSGGSVPAIAVNCGEFSTLDNSQAITFSTMQDLTCPVTFEVTEGNFLISTAKDRAAQYQSKIKVTPYKSGNIGKLRNVYVRANATDHNEDFTGRIKVTSGEIDTFIINLTANVTCEAFTLTTNNHLGTKTVVVGDYFAGMVINTEPTPSSDDCTDGYTFDGWSTSEVEYGSVAYSKVTFPYTMPNHDVTLYPVYCINDTEDYHRVTSDLGANNWAGDYLIAASSTIVANGKTSTLGTINGASIDENIVPASFGNLYYVSLIAVEGGYVLKTQDSDKPYIYITDGAKAGTPTDKLTQADDYPLTIKWNTKSNIIIHNANNTTGYTFQYSASATPARFGFFKAAPIYLYKKSSLYTTSLICGTIEIQENDIVVTSTKDQSVKVTVPVKLTSPYNDAVAISGANVNSFSVITKENVPVNTDEVVNVELVYSPQAYNQLETETITLTATNGATTSFQVTGRSLPETFAIVAKVGNVWYALPSQGLNSETTPVGYPVKVDNNDNPTVVTSLPTKAEWALRNVYKVNGQNDRFAANGENLVFVNAENKTLYANNGNANIQTYAEYTNYAKNNPDRYEWVPTTTDLVTYTLKNVGRAKELSINVNATFGTHASNIASNNLRFLPINATYNPFDMQVVEWYPTKVLVQTEATLASVSATVGGIAVANPVVTKKGGKLYEISGLPLENNPTKILTISYDSYSCSKVIPIIISQDTKTVTDAPFSTLTKAIYNYSDLVVRDGAVLNITGAKNTPDKFVNVTIYPTAKVVVPENNQLSVYSLTFFGGIDDIYNGSTYTTNKYGVPQLSLKGTLGKTVTTMDYIMRVNLDQMYSLGVPYDVNLGEITYWDGSAIKLGDELYVSAYDGQARANLDMNKTWTWEVNFAEKVLKAGIGYTISAEPQAGDTYSILRMPMKSNISSGSTEEDKTVSVTGYANTKGATITDNHKGWNLLSNPYMTTISGDMGEDQLVIGYLIGTNWVADTYRYVTIPGDNGKWYYQQKFTHARLLPFKSFFVQVKEDVKDGNLSFALASRQNAPARFLQQDIVPREVEFELLLSNETQSDNMGLLISEEYTPAYEINADLEKMTGTMSVYTIYNGYTLAYNALSPLNAEEQIPVGYIVPANGEYTFDLKEHGDYDKVEHIYLIDREMDAMVDLLEETYDFYAVEKKNNNRFAISVILKSEQSDGDITTNLGEIDIHNKQPQKFFYDGELYILHDGTIYSATGHEIKTINE